jgi:hypothetical protein
MLVSFPASAVINRSRAGTGGRIACVMPAGKRSRRARLTSHPIPFPSPSTCPEGQMIGEDGWLITTMWEMHVSASVQLPLLEYGLATGTVGQGEGAWALRGSLVYGRRILDAFHDGLHPAAHCAQSVLPSPSSSSNSGSCRP